MKEDKALLIIRKILLEEYYNRERYALKRLLSIMKLFSVSIIELLCTLSYVLNIQNNKFFYIFYIE